MCLDNKSNLTISAMCFQIDLASSDFDVSCCGISDTLVCRVIITPLFPSFPSCSLSIVNVIHSGYYWHACYSSEGTQRVYG